MTTTSTTVSGAAGVRVGKPAVHNRVIEVAVASNARASAQMTLLKRGVALAKARAALRPGRNVLRLRAPRRAHGRYLLVVAVRVTGARPIVVRKVVRIP
jgi:hypothetical protein